MKLGLARELRKHLIRDWGATRGWPRRQMTTGWARCWEPQVAGLWAESPRGYLRHRRGASVAAAEWATGCGVGDVFGETARGKVMQGIGGKDLECTTCMGSNVLQPSKEFCCERAGIVRENWTVKDRTQDGGLNLLRQRGGRERREGTWAEEEQVRQPARQSCEYSFLRNRPKAEKRSEENNSESLPWTWIFFFLSKADCCLSPGGESGAGGWGKHFGTIPVRVLTDRPLPFPCPTRLGEESAPQVYLNRALLSDWATGKREKMQRMKSEGSSGSQIRLSLFLHGLWGDWSRGRQHNKIWNRCSTSGESSGYTSSSLPTASKAAWVEVLRHSPADETSAHSRASRKGRLKSAPTQITTRGSA